MDRIKLKPGYQRLWRNFRLALAESLNYKYIYQQQLTKYLTKFARKSSVKSYYLLENNLKNILIYSRLIPDLPLFTLFFTNNFIYLNHRTLRSWDIYVYKNDLVQLEITI